MQKHIKIASEIDFETVWRVDSGLCSITAVNKSDLHGDAPIDCWLPIYIGSGSYCYFLDKAEALKSLEEILNHNIKDTHELLTKLKEE